MKKLYRILGITLLVVLYWTAISLVTDISKNSGFSVKPTSENGKKDISVSINQFSNSAQAESLGNDFNNSLPTNLKDSSNGFSARIKTRELFFANEFSQYLFGAHNFLIKYGKANLIFPFHYFW